MLPTATPRPAAVPLAVLMLDICHTGSTPWISSLNLTVALSVILGESMFSFSPLSAFLAICHPRISNY